MSDTWPRFNVVSAQAGTKRNLGLGIYEITILLGELKLATRYQRILINMVWFGRYGIFIFLLVLFLQET